MADLPEAGSIWSFRTRPLTEFSPPATGRYGALKVVGRLPHEFVIVVLDGIWTRPPTLEDAASCGILLRDFHGEVTACAWGAWNSWWKEAGLPELTLLGVLSLRAEEARHVRRYAEQELPRTYAPIVYASDYVEKVWRGLHDRDAMEAEFRRDMEKREAKRLADEERYRTRLRGLTWETLLSETPLARWDESPPFPPAAFRDAARVRLLDTCRALQALGPKPRRPDARRLLKDCIEWFNAADAEAGEVVETEEREDILMALSEMAWVARQKALMEEIEEWRTW